MIVVSQPKLHVRMRSAAGADHIWTSIQAACLEWLFQVQVKPDKAAIGGGVDRVSASTMPRSIIRILLHDSGLDVRHYAIDSLIPIITAILGTSTTSVLQVFPQKGITSIFLSQTLLPVLPSHFDAFVLAPHCI